MKLKILVTDIFLIVFLSQKNLIVFFIVEIKQIFDEEIENRDNNEIFFTISLIK